MSAGPESPTADRTDAVEPVLNVQSLRTELRTSDRRFFPVDGVSFELHRGKALAIVGESGSGKSMTAASIIRLLPRGMGGVKGGSVMFGGQDLLSLSEAQMRSVRGTGIALMPQDPMTALNPSLKVGFQVSEPLLVHQRVSRQEARSRAADLLTKTGIPNVPAILDTYPHHLSGGMRQRVVLSMSLICRPTVLIADEPTTALDVTTQEQIIDLLQAIQQESGLSLILITHDLGVVARIADHVLVMYAGRPAEYGTVDDIFYNPSHPYTRGLLQSVDFESYAPRERLRSIPGVPPRMVALPEGCAFHPRCPYAVDVCRKLDPTFKRVPDLPTVTACHVAQAGELEQWQSSRG
jgi:oligopeptide/dipeptide ABC transporter ATP-binding protein